MSGQSKRRHVVETWLETTGNRRKRYYSRPLGYREAVRLLGEMTRDKHESQILTVQLTDQEVAEYDRMADAGVPPDYSRHVLS